VKWFTDERNPDIPLTIAVFMFSFWAGFGLYCLTRAFPGD
jgi:hypothetical protein